MGFAGFGAEYRRRIIDLIRTDDEGIAEGDSVEIHLFQNDIVPNGQTVLGDFVEADFDGYSPAEIASAEWTNSPDGDGGWTTLGMVNLTFQAGAGLSEPQNIFGWYMTAGTAPQMIYGARFQNVYTIANPFQALVVVPAVSMPPEIARYSPVDVS